MKMKLFKKIFFIISLITFILIVSNLSYLKQTFITKIIQQVKDISDNFENFTQIFDKINRIECDVKSVKIEFKSCLDKLHQLDIQMDQFRKKNVLNKCDECLKINNQKTIVYFHTFSEIKEKINSEMFIFRNRILDLNLMSYLATQNLCCTRFILWKLRSFPIQTESRIMKKFEKWIKSGQVTIREFNIEKLCKLSIKTNGSTLHKYDICRTNEKFSPNQLVAFSDLVRFVALDIYGGIYVDGDVFFLKDTKLLWNKNFAYRWSYTNSINTAIIGINKNIDTSINNLYDFIFEKSKISEAIKRSHPLVISKFLNSNDLYNNGLLIVYHSFLFDPNWLCSDRKMKHLNYNPCSFTDFYSKKISQNFTNEIFFPGSFTYHIHSMNPFYKTNNHSYLVYFENYFSKKVLG